MTGLGPPFRPGDDEDPTLKRDPVVCPRCCGHQQVLRHMHPEEPFDGKQWTEFAWVPCPGCNGAGKVTAARAAELRER